MITDTCIFLECRLSSHGEFCDKEEDCYADGTSCDLGIKKCICKEEYYENPIEVGCRHQCRIQIFCSESRFLFFFTILAFCFLSFETFFSIHNP